MRCLARDDLIFYIKDLIKLGMKPSVTAPTENEAAGGARDTPVIKPLIQVDLFTFENFAKFSRTFEKNFREYVEKEINFDLVGVIWCRTGSRHSGILWIF